MSLLLLYRAPQVIAPPDFPTPNYGGGTGGAGGGKRPNSRNQSMRRFYDQEHDRFEVPIAEHDEEDEENIIMAILLQVAHEIH